MSLLPPDTFVCKTDKLEPLLLDSVLVLRLSTIWKLTRTITNQVFRFFPKFSCWYGGKNLVSDNFKDTFN